MSETKLPLFYPCFFIGLSYAAHTGPMLRGGYITLFSSVIHSIYSSKCLVGVMGSMKDRAASNSINEVTH